MSLTLEEVEHIAQLARLELTSEEKEHYRVQLSAILDHARALQAVDTSNISPTSSVLPERSMLREDVPQPSLPQKDVLGNSAQTDADQFRVPPIFGDKID